jgi:hypothetical protein
MISKSLHEEISIELELMEKIVHEVASLIEDVSGRPTTVRERTAGAAFLAQFYGGIENILKRIHRYYNVPLPVGETWHLDLFRRFCEPGHNALPMLFDKKLASLLSPFRKFRHVVHHGYGFQIEWDSMAEGLYSLESVFRDLSVVFESFLIHQPIVDHVHRHQS